MIITGRTINQLPTLSAITSASTLILQTGNTSFKADLSEFAKSPVFGLMYQDLIPVSSNTFTLGSSGSTIKSINVGKISIGIDGATIGLDNSGVIYMQNGLAAPTIVLGEITSEGVQSTGVTLNIINNELYVRDISGTNINVNKQVVPTGGSISQVLAKNSDDDYDFNWLNLQGLYITGATSDGGGLDIFQSATTNTLSFRTITSVTPAHITIDSSDSLLKISGTGILAITNNGGGVNVAQSGTSDSVALRSVSSQTPSIIRVRQGNDLILFSGKTNNLLSGGTGQFYFISSITSSNDIIQKSISAGTYINISESSDSTITFSIPNLITGVTNNGGGVGLFQSASTNTFFFNSLSSQTPSIISILSGDSSLILFSGKTFITGATNLNNGIGIFKSASTTDLAFRSLSSSSDSLLIISNGDGLITFSPRQKYHGSFMSHFTQSATNTNTMYIMSAETTDISNGITVVNGSRFTVISSGTYNIQFSAQLEKSSNGSSTIDIWFRKNGNNIPHSNTQLTMTKNSNDKLVAAWNLFDTLTAGQYFEIAWSATDTGITLRYQSTQINPTRPEIPSVIVTVNEV